MTGNKGTRERFGAVFFAFIMVTSMVAIGGAAFAGSAGAQSSNSTIQVSDLSDAGGDDVATGEVVTPADVDAALTSEVSAQESDTTVQSSAPSGLATSASVQNVDTATSGGDGTFDASEEATISVDHDLDGSTTSFNVRTTGADTAVVSADGTYTDGTLDNGQVTTSGPDDEEITGFDGGTATETITIGQVSVDITIYDDGTGGNGGSEVELSNNNPFAVADSPATIDLDNDGTADQSVFYTLVDSDSDALYETLEISASDEDFGEGSTGDTTVADGNDEVISGSSGTATDVDFGQAPISFSVDYDDGLAATDVGDGTVDVSVSARAYEATSIDTGGDDVIDEAQVLDTDSDGIYDAVALSDDGTFQQGTTDNGEVSSSNDELLTSSGVFTEVSATDDTEYFAQIPSDPENNKLQLELYNAFKWSGTDVAVHIQGGGDIRLDYDQDGDFSEAGEGAYSEGEIIGDADNLDASPVGPLNELYYVDATSTSAALIEPVPEAGSTYDLRIYSPSEAGDDVAIDDIGVEAITPDDAGDYASPVTATLDGSGFVTISGLEFQFSTDATNDGNGLNDGEYVGVAETTDSAAGAAGTTDIADINVRSSDYGTVSISSNVDSLTYDTAQDVTVTVTDDGSALQGAEVKLIQDDGAGATTTLGTGFTNSDGEVSFSDVTSSAAGDLNIQVSADRGGDTGTTTAADGITDLQTSTTQPIEARQLQVTTSDNFLKDFQATPTFTVEYANGTTFDLTNNDISGDGVRLSISGDVIDESDSNDGGTSYAKDSFVTYVIDQKGGTPGQDNLASGNEVGEAQAVAGGSFTPEATGDLEVRAEYQADGNNNGPAEYNVTETFSVTEGVPLNINTNEQNALDADDSQDNLRVTVQGSDAAGPDGAGGNNLDTAEVILSGPGVSADTGGQVDFSTAGPFNDATKINGQSIDFDSINPNNNGTVMVTVNAVADDGSESTKTTNVSVAGNNLTELSPTGTVTSSENTSVSLRLSDGAGTALNNQQVVISEDGLGSSSAALFSGDVNGDGSAETINEILIDGGQGTIAYDIDDDASSLDATAAVWEVQNTIAVNNGVYQTPELAVESAGVNINVEAYDAGGNVQAFRTDFLTTQGDEVYDLSSDVDTFVAGYEEQVNITVTNTTSNAPVNGSELQRLADDDGDTTTDNLKVEQQGSSVISGTTTVDTDSDGTVDTIRGVVDADEDGSAAVNISVQTNDQQQFGSASVAVEAPQVQANVTNARLTENIQQDVNIEVVDPRDGSSTLASDNNGDGPALRLTAFNTTLEAQDLDAGNDFDVDGTSAGNQVEPAIFDASNTNNGQANATMMAYPDGDSGPQRLEFEVSFDGETDYFGSSNVTVEPKQVTATPSNITLGSQTTIELDVEDANGQPIPQQGVSLSGATTTSGSTDNSGFVAFTVNPSATGTINVDVDSDGLDVDEDGGTDSETPPTSTTDDTVNVTIEQEDFDVSLSQTTITTNESTSLTVTATNAATGDAVEGATVDLSGAGINESAQTDANGEASFTVTASSVGTVDVTVDDAGFNQATATITAEVGEGTDEELARFDGGDGIIDRDEAVDAIVAYNTGGTIGGEEVTRDQAVQVIIAYNTGQTVAA